MIAATLEGLAVLAALVALIGVAWVANKIY
jgi:hypothetical protein